MVINSKNKIDKVRFRITLGSLSKGSINICPKNLAMSIVNN